ncbi:MAG: 4Fe-4S binding protein [Planctomycetota bacterium]|jgi:cytochrome c oxidase accessory protein FixG
MPIDPDSPPDDFRSALATVDRKGRRTYVFADIAGGLWRRRRQALALLLISFYLALPFVRIGGEPLLLINIPDRRYILLGYAFWPQDFVYALLLLLLAVVATLLMVALCGRVFCGWLCPHNVFLEMVFRPIEQALEGRGHRRRRQDSQPLTGSLALRKCLKWGLYLLISGALANTACALFIGTDDFIAGLVVDPFKHPSAAVLFAVMFVINAANFGWLREQTCTVLCPYGRIQAGLLDQHTLGVAYDQARGEPRGKAGKAEGACVDCNRCVQVCPTGIDIRNAPVTR